VAKVLISIDDKLLRRLDREATAKGMTRSAYIADLAARELGTKKGPGADPRVRRAVARLDALFQKNGGEGDSTEIIRRMRDERTAHLGGLAGGEE
jgi:metal-responsive CopG/Arc/MetJ family transcriptional regulator